MSASIAILVLIFSFCIFGWFTLRVLDLGLIETKREVEEFRMENVSWINFLRAYPKKFLFYNQTLTKSEDKLIRKTISEVKGVIANAKRNNIDLIKIL